LRSLQDEIPEVTALSGRGCFRGITVETSPGEALPSAQVPDLVEAIRAAGAIAHPGVNGVQLVPVLTSTDAEVDELLDCLSRGIATYLRAASPAGRASA